MPRCARRWAGSSRALNGTRWDTIRDMAPRVLGFLWIAAVLVASVQAAVQHSNNFEIFRWSWANLVAGRALYAPSAHYRDLLDNYYIPQVHFDAPITITEIVAAGESRWEFHN